MCHAVLIPVRLTYVIYELTQRGDSHLPVDQADVFLELSRLLLRRINPFHEFPLG